MPGSTSSMMVKADASVACPHSSTSVPGVNQRKRYLPSPPTRNAVSDRLFSRASSFMESSEGHASITHTAAGLPVKGFGANVSTMYCLMACPRSWRRTFRYLHKRKGQPVNVVGLRRCDGGWGGSRTPDTGIFSPLLYQLSYPAIK